MKKLIMFVLALVLVLALGTSAAAQGLAKAASPAAGQGDLLPAVVDTDSDELVLVDAEDIGELSEEIQETCDEAREVLPEAVPEGMAVKYFFYADIGENSTSASVTFQLEAYEQLQFLQFVNGEWVVLEFVINADGTVTVFGIVDGPMAILVK